MLSSYLGCIASLISWLLLLLCCYILIPYTPYDCAKFLLFSQTNKINRRDYDSIAKKTNMKKEKRKSDKLCGNGEKMAHVSA
jgi:hypothetical protein